MAPEMGTKRWKVGELAQIAGVSVRTLHHYEAVGLLVPGERTAAGHRLYSETDVRQIYRILVLRRLGFALDDISAALNGGGIDLRETVRRHLEELDRQRAAQEKVRSRLIQLLEALDGRQAPSTQEFVDLLEVMTMHEKYYTEEQLAQLAERREALGGDEAMKRAEQDWADLIAAVEAERAAGSDPAGPRMQELAAKWQDLIDQFTGGDPEIFKSLKTMYQEEGPEKASRGMVDVEMMSYMQQALDARNG